MYRLAVAFTLSILCHAQEVNPHANDPQAAESGRWTFRILCGSCHGIHAEGGRGPDLTRGVYSAGDQDKDLFNVIARGVPGSEMPPYGERLDADATWRLVAYIRSAAKHETESVDGNAEAGEKVFWGKGACGQCHRVSAKGSGIGPDLTRIGRLRSLKYLKASIVKPDADITPGYGTIKVVSKDGTTISGVERGIDNFSAQFIDLSGKYHSVVVEEVSSIARDPRSLMPSYEKSLSARELNDLLAYLLTLRGTK